MSYSPTSATTVKLALAAYDATTTFFNPDIQNANGAVRLVVLEESFGRIDLGNTTFLAKTNAWINDMRTAGQLVFGYVACNSGESDPATVSAGVKDASGNLTASGIDTWYQRYPQIDGIYLDEGPQFEATHVSAINGKTIQDNYTAYSQAIQSKTVMDGTTQRKWRVMIEAAAYPFDWVLSVTEFILLWEGSTDDYENKYNGYLQGPDQVFPPPPPAWWTTETVPEHVVHTIWNYTPNDPANPPDMRTIQDVFAKAQGRGAGNVYLTFKFGTLPPYWNDEVAAV